MRLIYVMEINLWNDLRRKNFRVITKKLVVLIAQKRDVIKILHEDEQSIQTFPCLYLLLNLQSKKVYIGETFSIRERISQHINSPPLDWECCILMWDGRIYGASVFSSESLRKRLEFEVNGLFQTYSEFDVVSTAYFVELGTTEENILQELLDEIVYLLSIVLRSLINFKCFKNRLDKRENLQIYEITPRVGEEEVDIDYVINKLTTQARLTVTELNRAEKTFKLNGVLCFFRPGSRKRRGYQVTIRGTFLKCMRENKGLLIMNRGPVYIIPLKKLNEKFGSLMELGQDTLDVFFDISTDKLICHKREIDLSNFRLEEVLKDPESFRQQIEQLRFF